MVHSVSLRNCILDECTFQEQVGCQSALCLGCIKGSTQSKMLLNVGCHCGVAGASALSQESDHVQTGTSLFQNTCPATVKSLEFCEVVSVVWGWMASFDTWHGRVCAAHLASRTPLRCGTYGMANGRHTFLCLPHLRVWSEHTSPADRFQGRFFSEAMRTSRNRETRWQSHLSNIFE